jgi:hypothetical protein
LLRIVPTACGQAADKASRRDRHAATTRVAVHNNHVSMLGDCVLAATCSETLLFKKTLLFQKTTPSRSTWRATKSRSDPTYSRCQISRTRIDALWPHGACRIRFSTNEPRTRPGGARRDRTDDLLLAKQALSQLSYGPGPSAGKMVGLGRLELPTSRLSSARSNQLSYKPVSGSLSCEDHCPLAGLVREEREMKTAVPRQ